MKIVYAHSPNRSKVWHLLRDHCHDVAVLAAQFGAALTADGDLSAVCHRLGLLHDIGKGCLAWQARLAKLAAKQAAAKADHVLAGTQLAIDSGLGKFAWTIFGHHGGLTNSYTLAARLGDGTRDTAAETEACGWAATALGPQIRQPLHLPGWVTADALTLEMTLRMVYSCLIDADWTDTAAHFAGRRLPAAAVSADMAAFAAAWDLSRDQVAKRRADTPMAPLRTEVYQAAVAAATGQRGVYRLAAPTGAAKTLAMGGFALNHAATHQMPRVIIAVPYITVTEQVADVWREALGNDVVLEHHSHVDLGDRPRLRGTAENWDSPVVVTTTVQLFDSLFHRRPAALRKIHRLAGSVIVLDEVQALPARLLLPILSALRHLCEHFGATVLLSTATQPQFQELTTVLNGLFIHEIASPPQIKRWYTDARRVRWRWWRNPDPTLTQVAAEAATRPQALITVNTTADSRNMWRYMREMADQCVTVLHLSARMCHAHRAATLDKVKILLNSKQPLLLVSTALIECGVDISFPVVYRAWSPADSIIQTAGRCNRDGLFIPGEMIVFTPRDGGDLDDHRIPIKVTNRYLGEGHDPDDPDTYAAYSRDLYQELRTETHSVGRLIQQRREQFDFHAVTEGPLIGTGARKHDEAFRMIPDDTVTALVDYDTPNSASTITKCLKAIASGTASTNHLRQLQPYLVSTSRSEAKADHRYRHITGNLYRWTGPYHDHYGLDPS